MHKSLRLRSRFLHRRAIQRCYCTIFQRFLCSEYHLRGLKRGLPGPVESPVRKLRDRVKVLRHIKTVQHKKEPRSCERVGNETLGSFSLLLEPTAPEKASALRTSPPPSAQRDLLLLLVATVLCARTSKKRRQLSKAAVVFCSDRVKRYNVVC